MTWPQCVLVVTVFLVLTGVFGLGINLCMTGGFVACVCGALLILWSASTALWLGQHI